MTPLRDIWAPLRDRRFLLLWSGQTLSHVGDAITAVALALAIVKATGSATDLGIVLAAQSVATVTLMLPGGVWADRLPRHRVMLTADVVRGIAHAVMGIELVTGTVDIVHLAVLAAVSGAGSAFFLPATTGLVPATVAPELLPRANALMAIAQRGAMLLGPGIATTIALTAGPGWALLLDAVTYAVSAVLLGRLRIPPVPAAPHEPFVRQLADGWLELGRHRWYWTNLIGHSLWNLGRCVLITVGPVIAVGSLGGELAWGTIVQGGTIGALCGALLVLRVRPRRPLAAANIGLALGALPLVALAAGAPALVVAAAYGMMTGGLAFMAPLWETAVQEHIPAEAVSRVSAYDWMLSLGLMPFGMALAGPLADAAGTAVTLYGSAAVIAISSLGVLLLPDIRDLGMRDAEDHHPDRTGTDGDLPGRTGPGAPASQAGSDDPSSRTGSGDNLPSRAAESGVA
ncbi:MFS family permease [Streptosporangium becharense]|uniref:MFS family permease n=1 Tax=Streptosporangium becharense TaxID=1816182 RepID=A0A7W9IEK7_9ACTN|nr:MFS transporter [Streptosporangium becharense]MBB2912101.1 MFS family permease [Streptosporangium becharense]MBB5818648.1 MFS family permease [Streptosporangium becharense]